MDKQMLKQIWRKEMTKGLLLPLVAMLAACGTIPTAGPSGANVASLGQQQANSKVPQVSLVDMDEQIVQAMYRQQQAQTFADLGSNRYSADAVRAGDILEIAIWEAPPAVLFGTLNAVGTGAGHQVALPEQMVSDRGTISIPYVGNIVAAGKTPLQIQELIRSRLIRKANQPQVLVRLAKNNAQSVNVIRAGNSVRLPLSAAGERVLDAVAAVGGSTTNVQDTNVQLTRGNTVRTLALEKLVANPQENIYLHRGDVVTLITNPSTFTAMGAVGRSQQIGFSARGLSLAEAIGRMGGLEDRRSDARGVFVFRYAPVNTLPSEEQARWLARGERFDSEVPVVYRFNLTDANALFWMQRFPIADKDVVYVSNAPLVEVQKFLQFVFQPATNSIYYLERITN